jgi:pimeloyl-ACP methyl ester carboxylesterase
MNYGDRVDVHCLRHFPFEFVRRSPGAMAFDVLRQISCNEVAVPVVRADGRWDEPWVRRSVDSILSDARMAIVNVMTVTANGIEIAVESFGEVDAPPILLVMGLGSQMLHWPAPFCTDLAARGYRVVRFDNRDMGQSQRLDALAAPGPVSVALRRRHPSYRLEDLAGDTIGVIDALGLRDVHLVGASMGSFVSQLVAIRAADRLASLTLMMTSTGSRRVGQAKASVIREILRRRPATDRTEAIEQSVSMLRLIGSTGYPFDEDGVRELAGAAFDRGYSPAGQRRQLGAVIAQTDRTAGLRAIRIPTLVIHGLSDPLVAYSGGLAVARAVPSARFVGFSGMGHDLPKPLWDDFIDQIVALTHSATKGLL